MPLPSGQVQEAIRSLNSTGIQRKPHSKFRRIPPGEGPNDTSERRKNTPLVSKIRSKFEDGCYGGTRKREDLLKQVNPDEEDAGTPDSGVGFTARVLMNRKRCSYTRF